MPKSLNDIDPDLLEIAGEMREEIVRVIENACKKIQNLKLGGPDAQMIVSLVLANGWSSWLLQLTSQDRATLFQSGTQMISDDLLEKFKEEINGTNQNTQTQ
jgi:hypothetical protein